MLGASPLESQVVLGADAGKHCQLLATQTRRAALPAGNQPDIFGTNLVPPRTQEITQRVGFRRHGWSLCPASTPDQRGIPALRSAAMVNAWLGRSTNRRTTGNH